MFDRHIAFAARQTPYLIAISNGPEHISYRALDRAVDGVAGLLSSHIEDRGQAVVGLSVRDGYHHALLVLACARLGVASASLFAQLTAPLALLVGASLVITDDPSRDDEGKGWLVVDPGWFARAFAPGATGPQRLMIDPAGLARVQLSSGSTGEPKAVEISWATMDTRVANGLLGEGDGLRRMLTLIGLESGGLQTLLTTWKYRGTALFAPAAAADVAAMLPVLQPTGMLASPVQLAALIDALPVDAAPMARIELAVAGGKISRALAQAAAVRLGARVAVVYASTEAGTTAMGYAATLAADGAVGFVTPSCQVEIVDDAGLPIAAGEIGQVRISGQELASGYRGDGADTAFNGGFFMPGDLGSLDADGLLRIVGRIDEVMNLGGEKFLPDAIEGQVRPVAGVADVAAFALDDAEGNAQPWLAVVRDGEIEEGAIGRALTIPGLPPVRVAWIEAIPRTLMGKVRRDELRQAARLLGG